MHEDFIAPDTLETATITFARGGRACTRVVKFIAVPYHEQRAMVWKAQAEADQAGPSNEKPASSRYEDAIVLRSIKEYDGQPFTLERWLAMKPDAARAISALAQNAGVVDEEKSGESSATAPAPARTSPTP